MPDNVLITSARYANAQNTVVWVVLSAGEEWYVNPNNGSGQANVLAAWLQTGGSIGPFVPPVPGGVVPPGSVIWYAASAVPSGQWLLCDGTQVKRAQYPNLYSAIGGTFGTGDGSTTFNLPDLRGKFIRGWGPVNSLDPNRKLGTVQGDLLGTHRHKITDRGHIHFVNDPGHVHPVNDPGHTHTVTDPGHTHGVTDPGHKHTVEMIEDNLLFGIQIVGQNPEVITPYPNSPSSGNYSPFTDTNSADISAVATSANVVAGVGEANVSDKIAFTGITVNPAVTNITETNTQGGFQTRPANLALLPYIKY
jgi:microcystin-dependent protein